MVARICKWVSILLLLVLLGLAALLALPHAFKIQPLVVQSGSMEPTIPVGSLVYVKSTPFADIKEHDVVTYRLSTGQYATHRVIAVNREENSVRTKGDANAIPDDAPIPYANIEGKVLFHVPFLGFLANLIQSRNGIILGAGVLVLLVLVTFLPEIFAKTEEEVDENGSEPTGSPPNSQTTAKKEKKSAKRAKETMPEFVPFVPYTPEMLKAKMEEEKARRRNDRDDDRPRDDHDRQPAARSARREDDRDDDDRRYDDRDRRPAARSARREDDRDDDDRRYDDYERRPAARSARREDDRDDDDRRYDDRDRRPAARITRREDERDDDDRRYDDRDRRPAARSTRREEYRDDDDCRDVDRDDDDHHRDRQSEARGDDREQSDVLSPTGVGRVKFVDFTQQDDVNDNTDYKGFNFQSDKQ